MLYVWGRAKTYDVVRGDVGANQRLFDVGAKAPPRVLLSSTADLLSVSCGAKDGGAGAVIHKRRAQICNR